MMAIIALCIIGACLTLLIINKLNERHELKLR